MLAGCEGQGPNDDGECRATEDEVAPLLGNGLVITFLEDTRGRVLSANYLVVGHNESTDQSSDDHDLVDEKCEEYRRPR